MYCTYCTVNEKVCHHQLKKKNVPLLQRVYYNLVLIVYYREHGQNPQNEKHEHSFCGSHPLPLPLSSCLGCIPPLTGLPLLRSLLRSVLCGYLSLVCFFCFVFCSCFLFLVYRDDVLCWLLSCPVPEYIPGLIWFGSLYLVTTAAGLDS